MEVRKNNVEYLATEQNVRKFELDEARGWWRTILTLPLRSVTAIGGLLLCAFAVQQLVSSDVQYRGIYAVLVVTLGLIYGLLIFRTIQGGDQHEQEGENKQQRTK